MKTPKFAGAMARDLARAGVDVALEGLAVGYAEQRRDAALDRLEVPGFQRDERARVGNAGGRLEVGSRLGHRRGA